MPLLLPAFFLLSAGKGALAHAGRSASQSPQDVLPGDYAGMPCEVKTDQTAKLITLLCAHDLTADIFKADTVGIGTGFCVLLQKLQIVRHGIVEQGEAIIKNRRGPDDFSCAIIPQDTEVPEMPILVVNHGVEHQHTSDFLCGLLADFLIIVQTSLNAVCFYQMADRDIRRINIREQLAFGRENIFPALQIVVDGMKPHTLRDLAGVIFAVRLASGIGHALRAALIEINAIPLDKAPCFAKHTLCRQLWGCGKGFTALADAGVGYKGEHAEKTVFIEAVFLKCPREAQRHDPIAVIERQAFANVDNAFGVVNA